MTCLGSHSWWVFEVGFEIRYLEDQVSILPIACFLYDMVPVEGQWGRAGALMCLCVSKTRPSIVSVYSILDWVRSGPPSKAVMGRLNQPRPDLGIGKEWPKTLCPKWFSQSLKH